MIKVSQAKEESRPRDLKRKRILLEIGLVRFHLTRKEARDLIKKLSTSLKKRKGK